MKTRIIIPALALAILSTGCRIRPDAGFTVSETVTKLGNTISFTNISHNAVSFEWDFGDGNVSYDVNPVYRYDYSGTFMVELKAFSEEDVVDRAYIDVTILPNVVLDILVVEYWDEYPVSKAQVLAFPSWQDWLNETNLKASGITNGKGIVVLKENLAEQAYYLDIWEADHDNYTLAGEDPENVKTPLLYNDEINYITAYVDYYPPSQMKSARPRIVRVESTRPKKEFKR